MKSNKYILLKITTLCLLMVIMSSCHKTVKYQDETIFKDFLSKETKTNVNTGKSLIFVLQNSDCICTDANIKFTLEVFNSKDYKNYKKTLIVLSPTHRILSMVKNMNISVFSLNKDLLYKSGLILTTDRVFIFNEGNLEKYSDMHIESIQNLHNEYL